MPGFSDFMAELALNTAFATNVSGSRFLALFTTAPTGDGGTGGTEVSGTSYARVQFAGNLTAAASFTTSSTTLTLSATAPAWLLALGTNGSGVSVYDITAGAFIGTVSSISGTTVTLTAAAAHASSGSADSLQFSAFGLATASSGTEPNVTPASITNGAQINFATAGSGGWGTVVSFGSYDAITGGNFYADDYLGSFKWIPFTCTSASPGVFTTDSSADAPANGSSVVVTAKFGGTLPTTSGSFAGLLTTAGLSANTFNVGVNTTSIGAGQFRQVTSQSIPSGVTSFWPASSLTFTSA